MKNRKLLRWQDVLVLRRDRKSQGTIRRCYNVWRAEMGIRLRCDNPICIFHAAGPREWNGQALELILDHEDGNKWHNLPSNLRYLCPNCDSQLPTRGGANRRRVELTTNDGYILRNRDGTKIAGATARMSGKGALRGAGRVAVDREQESGGGSQGG
jgi:hypothetical protein